MISRDLEMVFNRAVEEAKKRRHDMVTLEHIFLAMYRVHEGLLQWTAGSHRDRRTQALGD